MNLIKNQRDYLMERLVELWHETAPTPGHLYYGSDLSEWIGWSKDEYADWLEDSNSYPLWMKDWE